MKENISDKLKKELIGVYPTDTLYGVLGSALSKKAVEKIYKAKKRDENVPFLVLISKIKDLEIFGISLSLEKEKLLKKYWPGKVTVVLPLYKKFVSKFTYIHRGKGTIAFRFPKKKSLIALLNKTGPLVAPSANISGLPPSKNLKEAKAYFGDSVDFYVAGKISKKASKIISLVGEKPEILRK
jgi:L-threonylcarbamoyladenylate synthase